RIERRLQPAGQRSALERARQAVAQKPPAAVPRIDLELDAVFICLERDGAAVHEGLQRIAVPLDLENAPVLGVAVLERELAAADEIRARLRGDDRTVAAEEAREEQRARNGRACRAHSSVPPSTGRMILPETVLIS